MLGDPSNIKNFNWNLLKPLKITIFGPTFAKMRCPWVTTKTKHIFLEIKKPDPKLSKPFYFNKVSYVLAECL